MSGPLHVRSYTRAFPVERSMREAEVMQIFEGTNQIQRLVISRDLARRAPRTATHVLPAPSVETGP